MHLKRIISGLIPLPVLIFAIVEGGVWFVLLVAVAALLALWEYGRIVTPPDSEMPSARLTIFLPIAIAAPVVIWSAQVGGAGLMMVTVGLAVVAMGAAAVLLFPRYPAVFKMVPPGVFGLLYIPASLGFLVAIREASDGVYWIFFIICMVFLNDIAAFYCGTQFGKRKLWPAVSPGKTIEGALGGLAGNLLAGSVGIHFFLPNLAWPTGIAFFLIVGIAGQVGDLFESELKRSSRIKDSSGLLPGHGGFLDRIDALLFASPVAYLFKMFII